MNFLLERDLNSMLFEEIYLVPAVIINENLVKEELTSNMIKSAICDKLLEKPDVCSTNKQIEFLNKQVKIEKK